MTKVLVTGGTGYIGSHTVVELIESDYEVLVVDNLLISTTDSLEGIKRITGKEPQFIKADCSSKAEMTKVFG